MKTTTGPVLALCGLVLFASVSEAQMPGQTGGVGGGRAVSPYLNLLQGGNTALNYYGLVRPQIAAGKLFQEMGGNINALETSAKTPLQTGNASSFMTHKAYFMNNGASAGRQGGQVGAAPQHHGR
jgi:hypothetical protein